LVVGDSTIITRNKRGAKNAMTSWTATYSWRCQISAHWGEGFAKLSEALQQAGKDCAVIVYWNLNDVVVDVRQAWVHRGVPDLDRRAATLASLCRQFKQAFVFVGGSGVFWDIQGAAAYDEDVQVCLRVFREWGIHCDHGMSLYRTLAAYVSSDGRHFTFDAQSPWWTWQEQILIFLQLADMMRPPLNEALLVQPLPQDRWLAIAEAGGNEPGGGRVQARCNNVRALRPPQTPMLSFPLP
jgi:hypothetical protein